MIPYRKRSFYEKYIKRIIDIVFSLLVILCLWWLYIIIAIFVVKKLGKPVIFKQARPGIIKGGTESIFYMYKFRTMTDAHDENGVILPDKERLTKFGKMLRATSLDELPEVFNILKGDMSIVGPRPQLIKDVVFMSDAQRKRHTIKPGLSGLAQVMGRNSISWEDKINWDLLYLNKVSFLFDLKIVLMTFKKVFLRKRITESNVETDLTDDYGDALLKSGRVSQSEYDQMQESARLILLKHEQTGL